MPSELLLQPLRWCCVDCVIYHEWDVLEEQHHTYMWREQGIIEWSWHVNCCLLPQCEALRIWRSEFPIATLPIGFYIKNKRGIRGIVLEKTFIVQYLSHSSSNRIHKYNRELSLLNEVKFIHGGHSMWTDPGPVTQYFRFCSNLTPSVLGGITFKKCMNHFIPSLCTTTACQMIELESCSNPQQLWAF